MNYKILGAIFIVIGCGSVGFYIASCYLKEERLLRQLVSALDYMECELQYHLTPLPDLCRQTAAYATGSVSGIFRSLAAELEDQIHPDVQRCMDVVLARCKGIPARTTEALRFMGASIGRFDLEGQLKGLEAVRQECRCQIESLSVNKEARIRSYQTLGLCAGAAIAILFV